MRTRQRHVDRGVVAADDGPGQALLGEARARRGRAEADRRHQAAARAVVGRHAAAVVRDQHLVVCQRNVSILTQSCSLPGRRASAAVRHRRLVTCQRRVSARHHARLRMAVARHRHAAAGADTSVVTAAPVGGSMELQDPFLGSLHDTSLEARLPTCCRSF